MINILKKRKEFSISQEYLAKEIGVSRPTLIKIEKGERKLKKDEEDKIKEFFNFFEKENQEKNLKINIPQEKEDKFRQVFLYILNQIGAKPNVGQTVLYKILYFIDFDYYEKYQKQLMGLTYFKNKHGPTPRNFERLIKKMKEDKKIEEVKSSHYKKEQKKFLPRENPDLSLLTGQELDLINDVLKKYSEKNATEISNISHRDIPWAVANDLEDIDYEYVFYRSEEFSVK